MLFKYSKVAGLAVGAVISASLFAGEAGDETAGTAVKISSPPVMAAAEKAGTLSVLPLDNTWKFKPDPDSEGITQKWFAAGTDASQWAEVRSNTGNGYESQGFRDFKGYSWYRQTIKVPSGLAERKHLFMLFGAVDQQCWIYINGNAVYSHTLETAGNDPNYTWRAPFVLDAKKWIEPGKDNVLAVRVYNTSGMGGIWKPVFILACDPDADLRDCYRYLASKGYLAPLQSSPYGFGWERLDLKWYESPLKADPVEYAKRHLESLMVGYHLLGDNMFKSVGMVGTYYDDKFKRVAAALAKVKPGSPESIEQINRIQSDLERLEQELIIESVNTMPCPSYSWRRLYQHKVGCKVMGDMDEKKAGIVQGLASSFCNEVLEQIQDWKRGCKGLASKGIDLDLSLEAERILKETPQTFAGEVPDRIYEQKNEFYRQIANERQRVAAELIQMENKFSVWKRIVELRQSKGAKLEGIGPLSRSVERALVSYRKAVAGAAYMSQVSAEKAARDALTEFETVATAKDNGVPVMWPGASVYSSGRLACTPVWQGLLNSEINHQGLFRSWQAMAIDQDQIRREWSFSFLPPGVKDFEMEPMDGSWVHRTRRYYYPRKKDKKRVIQEVTWSTLAPGTLVNTPGPAMALSDTTLDNPVPPKRVGAVVDGKPVLFSRGDSIDPAELSENWILLYSEMGIAQFPVLVVLEERPDELVWTDQALEVRREKGVGRTVIALPFGAAAQPVDESTNWKTLPGRVVEQVHKVLPLLTYYPVATREIFSVGKNDIQVWSEVIKAVELESADGEFCSPGKSYVPLPVLYGLSLYADIGFKVDSPLSDWMLPTKYGPYQVTHDSVLTYHVPKARMWNRQELRPVGADEDWVEKYEEIFLEYLPRDDVARYDTVPGLMPGYLMLKPENREKMRVYRNPKELDSMMGCRDVSRQFCYIDGHTTQMNVLIDPITAQYCWVRGWRRNRHGTRMRGDMPNRQAGFMLGAYCYARFFDEWDILANNWDTLKRCFSTMRGRQDWPVPAHTSQSTGFVFATDMLGDAWRCNSVMSSVARILGHTEEMNMAEYLGSIATLSAATLGHPVCVPYAKRMANYATSGPDRMASPYARDVKIGLFNTGPRPVGGPMDNLYSFTGVRAFDYPIYDALFTLYPSVGHYQHQGFGKNPLLFEPEYISNSSGAITLGNYMKYRSWAGLEKSRNEELWETILSFPKLSSSTMKRVGILNAIPSLIAQGNHIWLSYWDTAKLDDGTYDREKRLAEVMLTASRPGVLEAVSSLTPKSITVNGRTLKKDQYSYDSHAQELRIPFAYGKQEISIQLSSDKPSGMPGMMTVASNPKGVPYDEEAPMPAHLSAGTLSGDIRVGKTAPIDLTSCVNADWSVFGEGTDPAFSRGMIDVRGVPFRLVSPEANANKSLVAVGGQDSDSLPAKTVNIAIGKRIRRIFFLHACNNDLSDADVVVKYRLNFKTGQTRTLSVKFGEQIAGCVVPPGGINGDKNPEHLPDLNGARGSQIWPAKNKAAGIGVGGYVYSWKNAQEILDTVGGGVAEYQKGLDVLESVDIISGGKAPAVVLAITVELDE